MSDDTDDIDAALQARAAQASQNSGDDIEDALQARANGKSAAQVTAELPKPTVGREAGIGARAVATGAAGLPDSVDAIVNPVGHLLRGGFESPAEGEPKLSDFIHPSRWADAAQYFADKAGLAKPVTPGERVYSAAAGALPGAVLTPEALIPGAVSSMAGGAASQTAKEAGIGGAGQLAAGVLAGGAAGGAAGGIRSAMAGASPVIKPAGFVNTREDAVNLLKSENIPLSYAQETGSKLAQHVERASAMTGDNAQEFAAKQGSAFNRAVLKRAGISGDAATPDVMGPGKDRITDVMNDYAKNNPVHLDDTLLTHLSDLQSDAPKLLPDNDAKVITANIDDIVNHAAGNGGKLDGTYVQKLNTRLGKLSQDPKVAPVIHDLQEHVADAMERSATNPDDLAALQKARQQYRVLKQIEPAVDPTTGDISPNKLMNAINVKKNRNQSLYGSGDQSLVNLAKAAKIALPDKLGNSGTAERVLPAQGAIETLGAGEPLKAGAKFLTGTLGLNASGRMLRNQGSVRNSLPGITPNAKRGALLGGLASTSPIDQSEQ